MTHIRRTAGPLTKQDEDHIMLYLAVILYYSVWNINPNYWQTSYYYQRFRSYSRFKEEIVRSGYSPSYYSISKFSKIFFVVKKWIEIMTHVFSCRRESGPDSSSPLSFNLYPSLIHNAFNHTVSGEEKASCLRWKKQQSCDVSSLWSCRYYSLERHTRKGLWSHTGRHL